MHRINKVVVRLSASEAAAVVRLALLEQLPISTMTRRLLLREAAQHGLWIVSPQYQDQIREAQDG